MLSDDVEVLAGGVHEVFDAGQHEQVFTLVARVQFFFEQSFAALLLLLVLFVLLSHLLLVD